VCLDIGKKVNAIIAKGWFFNVTNLLLEEDSSLRSE